jgi:hypothetical protein
VAASYPKPDGQKVNRVEPTFGWVDLPAGGRPGPAPKLPTHMTWSAHTKRAWDEMWASPQATQWDQSGRTLIGWAELFEQKVRAERLRRLPAASMLAELSQIEGWEKLLERKAPPTSVYGELRQIEDRHGLNPKAMLQLRWRIPPAEAAVDDDRPPVETRRRRLRVV